MTNNLASEPDAQPDSSLVRRVDHLPDRIQPSLDLEDGALQHHSSPLVSCFHALRRRWFMALSLGLISAAVAASAVWLLNKDRYTAKFQFRVAATPESIVFDDKRAAARDEYEIYKNSQQLHVKGDYVLNSALRDKTVAHLPIVRKEDDPVRWLTEEIKVNFPGNGEVMNISLTADSPQESAMLVAAVSKAYLDEVVNQDRMRQKAKFVELKSLVVEQNTAANKKRDDLRRLSDTLGTKSSKTLSNQERMAVDQWNAVRKELYMAQIEVTRLSAELELKKTQLQQATDPNGDAGRALVSAMDSELRTSGDLLCNELKRRVEMLQQERDGVRSLGSPNQQKIKDKEYEDRLKDIDQKMSARKNEIAQELRRIALAYLQGEVTKIESELATRQGLQDRFAEDEKASRAQVKEYSGSSQEVEDLEREISKLDGVIRPMDQQVLELEVELGRPSRVQRITRVKTDTEDKWTPDDKLTLQEMADAIQPRSPDPNSQISKALAAGFAALGLVIGGILFVEARAKRVNSSLEVSQTLGLQVIGAIPLIPTKAITRNGGNTARYRRWRTLLNESMRGVMVRLLHEARTGQSQIVMVSSASAGEGKSTLATNLAVAMARAGYSTLLVDFDLHRPTLGDLFDLPVAPGVSEILRHEVALEDTINTVSTANLSVLTAGEWSPYHVSVLANGDTEHFFDDLRQRYQFIVVDGSPILGVAEAQLLCRHADTVLLSVLRDVSSSPKITAACETLAAFGVRSLYAVVTGAANSDYAYYYGGYGYHQDDHEQ